MGKKNGGWLTCPFTFLSKLTMVTISLIAFVLITDEKITLASEKEISYEDILEEYKEAAENNFESDILDDLPYVSDVVKKYSGENKYSVYYRYADLDQDGNEDLVISVSENESPRYLTDIYALRDGEPVRVLECEQNAYYELCYDYSVLKEESDGFDQMTYYKLSQDDNQYIEDSIGNEDARENVDFETIWELLYEGESMHYVE